MHGCAGDTPVARPHAQCVQWHRGDPAGWDLTEAANDFSSVGDTVNTWYEFDLNAIASVPTAAKAVLLHVIIADGAADTRIYVRDAANSNNFNRGSIYSQIANVGMPMDMVITITDAKVDIQSVNAKFSEFTTLALVVKGWWL